MPTDSDQVSGGLWGAIVGDALGVPVEFKRREEIARDPVTGMRGYGTHHQPPGTWSDDSSMLLCTTESLLAGLDTRGMARLFLRWLDEGYWTPWGRVFDIGNTTRQALDRIARGAAPESAGSDDAQSNGNGSLMRILPIALRFAHASPAELAEYAHRASRVTHRHPRAQMACGFYCLMAAALIKGAEPETAYHTAIQRSRTTYQAAPFASQADHFERLWSGEIAHAPEAAILSTGYVIHTLEASVWCLLNTNSFEQCVLTAVNLGEDTDTTGCVAGGLAGIFYGLEAIPADWLQTIARRDDIQNLFERFVSMPNLP